MGGWRPTPFKHGFRFPWPRPDAESALVATGVKETSVGLSTAAIAEVVSAAGSADEVADVTEWAEACIDAVESASSPPRTDALQPLNSAAAESGPPQQEPSTAEPSAAPPTAAAAGLLAGWEAVRDEHGQLYYANFETGESSWDAPVQGPRGPEVQPFSLNTVR